MTACSCRWRSQCCSYYCCCLHTGKA